MFFLQSDKFPDACLRTMLGREHLTFQGYPWQQFADKFPAIKEALLRARPTAVFESLLGDLGGNAFPAPVVLAFVMALLMSIPWVDVAAEDEVQLRRDVLKDLLG